MNDKVKNLTVRFTKEEYADLSKVSIAEKRPMANLINLVTMNYVENYLRDQGVPEHQE